ncbi:hypothetical protein WA026_002289 [Henosepilachna vigintioctopunctata]|uniref:Uncharacterized protein n=1 Tax=Henosepilachna vigintioctopunctata TaxID=420089 RepID=A0AAW1U1C1_9CUCU
MARWNVCVFFFMSALYITTSVPINPNQIQELNYGDYQRNQVPDNLQQRTESEIAPVETIIASFDEENENQKDEIMKTAHAMVFRPYFRRSMPRIRFYRPVRRVDYYPMYVVPYHRSLKSEDTFPLIA